MYGWMGIAILVSAATAYLLATANQGQLLISMAKSPAILWGSMILWFVIPFVVSVQSLKRPTLAGAMLLIYSILSGVMFSTLGMRYTGAQIFAAFVSAAAVFVSMSIFGLVTRKNLDKMGTQAMAALIGLLIAMVINWFLHSSAITMFLSFAAVIIFTLLTAWDTQRMKTTYNQYSDSISTSGLAIFGALQLYLDFVNLFLQLLQLFGGSNRN